MDKSVPHDPSGAILRFRDAPLPKGLAAQNRARLIGAFDAAAAGDKRPFWELFDRNVILHEAACLPYGGTHEGLESAQQAYGRIHEAFDEIRGELEEVLASENLAVAYQMVAFRAHEGGNTITMPVAEVYRFRDGNIVEWRPHYFDPRLVAEMLAGADQQATVAASPKPVATEHAHFRNRRDATETATRNRDILVGALNAMVEGDTERWWSIYDPEVVFHEASTLPYGGAHVGIDAVKQAHKQIHQAFDRVHAVFEAVMAAGDIVIAYQQIDYRVRKNGVVGSFPVAEVFRFRNGKVIEWRALYFDADTIGKRLNAE